jgi:hypothetical protein
MSRVSANSLCSGHRELTGLPENRRFAHTLDEGNRPVGPCISQTELLGPRIFHKPRHVSEFFHIGPGGRVSGLDPERRYYSRASFSDPDGNVWLLQEITTRLPGRVDIGVTSFGSASDLASVLRRAAAAHGKHEKRIGAADQNWPDWYAEYMVR